MLSDGALVAIIVALLAGGRFSRLGDLDLRWPWLFVGAFGLKFALPLLGMGSWPLGLRAAPALHLLSYLLLVAAILANATLRRSSASSRGSASWRRWPMRIALVGALMNFAVIAANGGAMPAAAELVRVSGQPKLLALIEAGRYPTHSLMTPATRLPFLADCLLMPPPYPRPCVFSLGDIFITLGVALLILRGMGAFGWGRKDREQTQEQAPAT